MKRCPKCSAELLENATECEQCTSVLPLDFWRRGTVSQADQEPDLDGQRISSDSFEERRPDTIQASDGLEVSVFEIIDAAGEPSDAMSIELEDDQDEYEKSPTFQAIDKFDESQFISTDIREEISRTNIAADIDSSETSNDSDNPRDQVGTARFSSDFSRSGSSGNTIGYDSQYPDRSTHEAGSSGSEGRYRRLWKGQLGSSKDPMHSLLDAGLEASGQIFDRVVERRVSGPDDQQSPEDDYQIGRKLGDGGMGIVYAARQLALNRTVAFKTARPEYQVSNSARRQFLYEAQITAELDHSNIVPIYELGQTSEKKLFYSMKLIEGTEWLKVLRKNTLDKNLDIFAKVADAVAYAHTKGIIHRDLKPENTMVSRYGEVFVTDWGTGINLTKMSTRLMTAVFTGERKLTVENASIFSPGDKLVIHDGERLIASCDVQRIDPISPNQLYLLRPIDRNLEPSPMLKISKQFNPLAGTPCYMAPEMAEGCLPKIGKTCDIYVLGGILYDIITGKPPHVGKTKEECLFAAVKNQIFRPKLIDPLLDIAYRALETDPKDRFPTVEAMQDAIREYRRNAESIVISNKATDHLQQALATDDYELFNRSIFGYKNALDLWADNTAAVSGLAEARLAIMKTGLKRGDYDLVLQTGNEEIDAESEIVEQATKAKTVRDGREKSFKLLRRTAVAISLLGLVALSVFSVALYRAYLDARAAKSIADRLAKEKGDLADEKTSLLEKQEKLTENEEKLKKDALRREELLRQTLTQRDMLLGDKNRAIDAQNIAIEDKNKALETARQKANEARQAEILANQRAAQVQIGEYAASLTLAKSRLDSLDIGASRQILNQLNNPREDSSPLFQSKQPSPVNWGWDRVSLLSNSDLFTVLLGGAPTAMDTVADRNTSLIATEDGRLILLRAIDETIEVVRQRPSDGSQILAVSLSPDLRRAVFASEKEGIAKLTEWDLDSNVLSELPESERRSFQCIKFSKDNRYLLAGINGGIWVWRLDATGSKHCVLHARIDGIRGFCEDIIQLKEKLFLVVDRFEKNLLLGVLSLADNEPLAPEFKRLLVDDELSNKAVSVCSSEDGLSLFFGMQDNTIHVGKFDLASSAITDMRVVVTQHRAPIDRFEVKGEMLVSASENEPLVHLWDISGELRYNTYLSGTMSNISRIGLLADSRVLLVDQQGTSMVLDIERQKRRRRLEGIENSAPIIGAFADTFDSNAITIDENGVVDLWSLKDGKSIALDSDRWSYIGHTPGAVYVDSAVDKNNGLVLTSARLDALSNEQRRYLADASHQWEFCVWELATGNMLRRWTESNRPVPPGMDERLKFETIEQRLSSVAQGLIFASDFETRLVDPRTGNERFRATNFGTYFAISNPVSPAWTMLVKRNGAVKLVDFSNPSTWGSKPVVDSTQNNDMPIRGQWSADGNRFYLLWASGGLTVFESRQNVLRTIWSSRAETVDPGLVRVLSKVRPRSHFDVDLNVGVDGEDDALQFVIRDKASRSTKHVALRFRRTGTGDPTVVSDESYDTIRWLEFRAKGWALPLTRVHDRFEIDPSRLNGSTNSEGVTFVSTSNAQVLALKSGETSLESFGRGRLVSATAYNSGRNLLALFEDGKVWDFSVANGKGIWTKTELNLIAANSIQASPNGSKVLVKYSNKSTLCDVKQGLEIDTFEQGTMGCWDSKKDSDRLILCSIDGRVTIVEKESKKVVEEKVQIPSSARILGLHLFNEAWSDKTKPKKEWLIIHVESDELGQISFVPLEEENELPPDEAMVKPRLWSPIPRNSVLATSPMDSIFLTGSDKGTVQLWMASPSWDANIRPLFELEGHRGARITFLGFSHDGKTVMSADSSRRLFGWMSYDQGAARMP